MMKRISIVLTVLLLCLLPALAQAENEPVTLQLKWKHAFQFAGFYMALEKGYYRDAGLDVRLIEGGPGKSAVAHVVTNQAAYGITSTGALLARSHGKPVKVIGAIFQHSPLILLVRKDSGINTWSDLRGKRIMLQQGFQNADIIDALKKAGLNTQDYIRQDISYAIDSLIADKTDAFAAYLTDQPHQMKLLGVPYRVLKPINQGVDFYGDIVITSDTEIREHPERVHAFMQASERGWNDALEHMDAAIDLILLKYNTQHLSRAQLLFEARESAKLIMQDVVHVGYMNDYRWQRIAHVYSEQGLLPTNYPVTEFLYQPEPSLAMLIKQNLWWIGLSIALLLLILLGLHTITLRQKVRHRTQALEYEKETLSAAEVFESDQRRILEKIINDSIALPALLEDIVRTVQRQQPSMLGSILLLDEEGKHLYHGAGPDLPDAYCRAIDGVEIGPNVGSCGTAVYRGEQVIVSDIASDPLWVDYKELAGKHGLAACWSEPVKAGDGCVLGTFAMYYQQPCAPGEKEIRLLKRAAALAANAIQHRRDQLEIGRLATILESTSDFVAMMDGAGHILYLNAAGRHLMGLPEDAPIESMSHADFYSPEESERIFNDIMPIAVKDGICQCECVCLHRDGHEIHTSAVFMAHDVSADGQPARYSVIARDLTSERDMQAKVEHSQRLESLGVLAGGIAHDFNNILTAILGNAALAERKALSKPMDTQRHLSNIVASSEKAAELCKQMLAYSGKGKFIVKALDLSVMVEEVSTLLEVSIVKNIVVKYHLIENLPAVEADAAQLQQVIMNLVINASDAIGDKSGVISIATGVMQADSAYLSETCLDDQLAEGRYVYLEVSDTGCGMDKTTQAKIFEPFFTTKFTGHGLGMSAVLGIVRGHHGAIKLYSEPEGGTTFKVLLPVSDQQAEAASQQPVSDDAWRGSGVVLIVDDEETIRETASMMLEEMGFATLTAVDGEDAVRVYRQHQNEIVAVLLDMTMPKMDGNTCFTELKRINPDVQVVLSSGYNEQEATSSFAGKGLAGFIQKPYLPEMLENSLRQATQKDIE